MKFIYLQQDKTHLQQARSDLKHVLEKEHKERVY
jgi:hypothetical protein